MFFVYISGINWNPFTVEHLQYICFYNVPSTRSLHRVGWISKGTHYHSHNEKGTFDRRKGTFYVIQFANV